MNINWNFTNADITTDDWYGWLAKKLGKYLLVPQISGKSKNSNKIKEISYMRFYDMANAVNFMRLASQLANINLLEEIYI